MFCQLLFRPRLSREYTILSTSLVRTILLLFTFAVTALSTYYTRLTAEDLPNIILLMGDDHGWDETGYNGHPYLKTPILDEMAANSLRLDNFYSAHPTCSPTRGSVLTGRHPNRYGTFTPNYSIRPEEITIAELLDNAGYTSGHFGKWHLGPVKKASPTSPGAMHFDTWLSHDNFFELNPVLSRDGAKPEKILGESSQVIVDAAKQFILNAKKSSTPFLAVIWFGSPHEPYSGLPQDLAVYDDLPQVYQDQRVSVTSNETGASVKRSLGEVLRERYAEITAMDRAIGDLRDFLKANDLRNDTLVWYCGDNGTSSDGIITSPFRGQKGNHYEGGVRVPGIIEWPNKIKTPKASTLSCVTSDMLPTLCNIVGVEIPDRPLDGVSLLPLLDGEMISRSKPICFWSFDDRTESEKPPYIEASLQQGTTPLVKLMDGIATRNFRNFQHTQIRDSDYNGTAAILDGSFKLIRVLSDKSAKIELYNLENDPEETNNLVLKDPDMSNGLQERLTLWQSSVLDSLSGEDYQKR